MEYFIIYTHVIGTQTYFRSKSKSKGENGKLDLKLPQTFKKDVKANLNMAMVRSYLFPPGRSFGNFSAYKTLSQRGLEAAERKVDVLGCWGGRGLNLSVLASFPHDWDINV